MSSDFLELNKAQREAVETTEGPLLVLAGAGAGKTKTVTYRILNLIQKGVAPENILAVTFTNKAAREMEERISNLLKKTLKLNRPISIVGKPFVATFHGLGAFIIKENFREAKIKKHFSIYNREDSKKAIREALRKNNYDTKQFEPGKILSIISREKSNFVVIDEYLETTEGNYFRDMVAKVWQDYEIILKKENALDFDDLLLVAAKLLQKKEIRKVYENRWKYIHIDEYQDTNKVQYQIVEAIGRGHQNVCAVGDTDQCLIKGSEIKMADGSLKKIENIKKNQYVLSNYGSGDLRPAKITRKIKSFFKGDLIRIKTKKGKIITSTPNHTHFAGYQLEITPQLYFNYLMYKKGIGWRIGTTQVHTKGQIKPVIGFVQRSNQEHADASWIIAVHQTSNESRIQEYIFSLKYQIPTLPFVPRKGLSTGGYVHDKNYLKKIFSSFNTEKSALKLLSDLGLQYNYPHHYPQSSNSSRININVTLCGDRRGQNPFHRISVHGNNKMEKKILETAGFSVRQAKLNTKNWRCEKGSSNYGEICMLATKIASLFDNSKIIFRARLGGTKSNPKNSNSLPCIPAGSVMLGMALFSIDGYDIVSKISRISVTKKEVFDIDVEKTHNFITNDIVTHNCIYSWRGANIKNILNFEKDYKNAKIVVLEQNYRSTKTILAVANKIIEKNKFRKERTLTTENSVGEKIGIFEALTENHEAQFIVEKVKELQKKGVNLSDMAVLYRANFQSRVLEEEFLAKDVPYQVLGTKFFDRKEIKDILAFLRFCFNPESISDLKRIINVPPRGIGKITLLKIVEGKEKNLPVKMKIKMKIFRDLLRKVKDFASQNPLSKTILFIAREVGLNENLKKTEEGAEKIENIKELVTLASHYDKIFKEDNEGVKNWDEAVEKLLEDTSLASDQDSDKKEKKGVRLMTVHASKGLEFTYIFITGLEEGLFPHSRSQDENLSEEEAEEERRLFYVAITRAKKKLFLSYAQTRTIFGSRGINIPSEFILEIPDKYLERESLDSLPTGDRYSKRKPLIHIEF